MDKKKTHSVQILETPFSTVSNRGHWFYTTRAAVERHLPGLLNFCTFEKLISRSIVWIDSANSLAMLLFLGLVFLIKPWPAIAISILFHFLWYHYHHLFARIGWTPILTVINHDLFQLAVAVPVLSYLGMTGNYLATLLGLVSFFLFKVGLLRMLWDRIPSIGSKRKLPLNDKTLRVILTQYASRHNISQKHITKIDQQIHRIRMDKK